MTPEPQLRRLASARIPTDWGDFILSAFSSGTDGKEHLAYCCGQLAQQERVLVRIHSECLTGDLLGSRRCDCGPQLQRSLQVIGEQGAGALLYLRQEGRGIGLVEKLRAYTLQDQGYDTVEANLRLGHAADEREYSIAAQILKELGVRSVELLTNNPTKVDGLQAHGIRVEARRDLVVGLTSDNLEYMHTKKRRLHHWLQLDESSPGDFRAVPERT